MSEDFNSGSAPFSPPQSNQPFSDAPSTSLDMGFDAPPPAATPAAVLPLGATPVDQAPLTRPRRRLRWLWWTSGSLAVASLVGLSAYLAVVAQQWSDRVDDLTAVSQDLGNQVADQTAARQTAEAKSAELQSQLDTATSRITTLANEEANATDHESVWINLVDATIQCADERQSLIGALKDSNTYYPGKSKAQVENEITAYCEGLKSDYADFKAEIGK